MTRKRKSLYLNKSLKFKFARALRPWHRRLGILSSFFILLLVLTGVAINHSQALTLGKTGVGFSWLLDFYGIAPPNHAAQFTDEPQPLFITDNLLWLGHSSLLEAQSQLISAVSANQMLIAIDAHQLYLFDLNGQLQETQNTSTGLPNNIQGIGIEYSRATGSLPNPNSRFKQIWLKTESGFYYSDENIIDWMEGQPNSSIVWVSPLDTIDPQWLAVARSANLTWERVILDLHSGRLFGKYAVWIWDLFAFALLLVSMSGLWIWLKQSNRKR